jgi:putative flippase GtrA
MGLLRIYDLTEKGRMLMIEKCRGLLIRYEEIIVYLIVGVLTTILSWVTCWIFKAMGLNSDIEWQNAIINTMGWVTGVLFGYATNRKYVFKSTNPEITKEFLQFAGARISTLILDIVTMAVTVNLLQMDFWISKIFVSSVLVTIANYVFSKLFVFKKK